MHRDLGAIFKAYDIRGIYPDQLDDDVARRIGGAFVQFTGAARIAVGRDMRVSSPALAEAFEDGAMGAGAHVIDVGQISTDGLYYTSGRLDVPGAMFTASHNPPEYNGLKLCRERAAPIGSDSGLVEIRKLAEDFDVDRPRPSVGEPLDIMDDFTTSGAPPGRDVEHMDMVRDYADHVRSFVDVERLEPLRVAIDAGNGMAGATVPVVFEPLPFEIVPLYFDLDGTFPNHLANPIEEQNLVDLQRTVRDNGCHVGIAFDGDADRMFLVDDAGEPISGSLTTALVADRILKKHPGEKIIYNLICSWTVPEVIAENGGEPIRTRVGHSFIKEVMARTGAVFGGEHSGHYYFRDNFRADSGMIAALLVLEAMSEAGVPLSETLRPFRRYAASGEINSVVADQPGTLEALARRYADGKQDMTDGLTVEYEDWWFNCRPSNTEPLLRLNLEARTRELMEAKRDEVLALIRGGA